MGDYYNLARGTMEIIRLRDALSCLRDAVDRRSRRPEGGIMQAEGGIMGPKGGIISIWPEGCGVINTLSHKKADNP